jgi:2-iminobutanoate/2-iminopropanoate deaminase
MNEVIRTDKASKGTGPYVQGRRVGDFVYVSGQGPLDPVTSEVVGETIEEQTRRTLENIQAILEAGGAKLSDVIKIGAYLKDLSEFGRFNEVYKEFFPSDFPCRTTVGTDLSGIKVEIDAIAYVGK